MKNNREKIMLNGYETWLDRSGYPTIWLYPSETAKNGISADVLYDGELISSVVLNDTEKKELLDYIKNTKT